jgi:hypothetical protein
MAYTTRVPVIAGLAILGGLTGVGIGRSTIAQVNPIHYQSASSHFYADLAPNHGSTTQAEPASTDYLQADYAYSASTNCPECGQYPVDSKPVHDRSVDAPIASWSASPPPEKVTAMVQPESEDPLAEPPPANRQWIERYTTYSVAAEPATEAQEVAPAQDNS